MVSVIIPVYNSASSIASAVSSALAQTYKDLEIIVVDDGSTDGTFKVLQEFGKQITLIRTENRGVAAARNTAIAVAEGEFLAFLDADDTWIPSKLHLQLELFQNPAVGLVYSDFVTESHDGHVRESYLATKPLAGEGAILERYLRSRFLLPSTVVLRRLCVTELGSFKEELSLSEDVEFFARVFTRWHAALVPLALTTRREGEHNLTADKKRTTDFTILALESIRKIPNLGKSALQALRQELGLQYWWQGYARYQEGDILPARQSLIASLRNDMRRSKDCVPLYLLSLIPKGIRNQVQGRRNTDSV